MFVEEIVCARVWESFVHVCTQIHKLFHMQDPKAPQMIPKVLCGLKDGIYLEIPKKNAAKML